MNAMPLFLQVVEGPSKGQEFRLEEAGAILVGRSQATQFALRSGTKLDTRISKRHAMIEFNFPRCWVHRVSSKNVLLLNGESVEAANLREGDKVTIGKTVFQVKMSPPPSLPNLTVAETTSILGPSQSSPDQSGELAIDRLACPLCGTKLPDPMSLVCESCERGAKQIRQPLSQYRLIKDQGKDRLGHSYIGLQTDSKEVVSVRIIPPASILPTAVSVSFLKELRQLQQIEHPHLGRVEEVGLQNGNFFVASKWIRGNSLIRYIKKRGPLRIGDVIGIGVQMLSALKEIHKAERVHGYLHPRNVYLRMTEKQSGVKIADTGIELIYRRLQIGGCMLPSEEPGNPSFLAPEILVDTRKACPASDQYSTGAILYYLLTGHRVFSLAKSGRDRIIQKLRDEPDPIREHRSDLPAKLISAIHCALSRDPRRRFADVSHFRAALKELLKK
jgi:serine/threonine-protein kinase